jgi:hypothetical protein
VKAVAISQPYISEKGSTYASVVGEPKGKRRLVRLSRDGIIILKWILHY